MKLDIDLGHLWARVKQMGAEVVDFDMAEIWNNSDISFDMELSNGGIEISLEDLESEEGLLSVKGRQVLLFIPDQGNSIEEALVDPSKGRKFHVADCITLEEMKKKNRFSRYNVTNNLSGVFKVYGVTKGRQEIAGDIKLQCCKNCLKQLNFKGYNHLRPGEKNLLVNNFSLEEFFSTYSSIFKHVPKKHKSDAAIGYTSDWGVISSLVRSDANYCCQHCSVDLTSNKKLLHTHHKNGVKNDNSRLNLVSLCADCHHKEPFHEHMFVKHSDTQLINALRKSQNLLSNNDWASVFKHADSSMFGVLDFCRQKNHKLPVIGYELSDAKGKIVAVLDLGWPQQKIGVCLGERIAVDGWKVFNLKEALGYFGA